MTAEEIIRRALDAQGMVPFIGKTRAMDFEPNPGDARRKARYRDEKEKVLIRQQEEERRYLLKKHRAIIEEARNSGFEYRAILAAVCMAHNIELGVLLSKKKSNLVSAARHHAIWELHTRKKFTRVKISQIMHRDHTTIIHSIDTVEGRKDLFANKIMVVDNILSKLGVDNG